MKIILTRGISGAGKSTWAATHAAKEDMFIVSRDEIRARYFNLNDYFAAGASEPFEDIISYIEQEEIVHYIEHNLDFIIDNTNLEPAYLKPYFEIFKRYSLPRSAVQFRDFPCDLQTALARNAAIGKNVSADLITHQLELFNKLKQSQIDPLHSLL